MDLISYPTPFFKFPYHHDTTYNSSFAFPGLGDIFLIRMTKLARATGCFGTFTLQIVPTNVPLDPNLIMLPRKATLALFLRKTICSLAIPHQILLRILRLLVHNCGSEFVALEAKPNPCFVRGQRCLCRWHFGIGCKIWHLTPWLWIVWWRCEQARKKYLSYII